MFDMHNELYEFYDQYVRLTTKQRNDLAGYRDVNMNRLNLGLDRLGHPRPQRSCDQGSFAMRTTNQHPDNDYDIDRAIIFAQDDLPASPLDARKRVRDAMIEGGGNFKKEPEARTNAVTVWYQEGHHVDLAVHRIRIDDWGNEIVEHAGVAWTPRDPVQITEWFKKRVKDLSPTQDRGANVEPKQLRRVVQLLKKFSKSRSYWVLPGGLVISTLAVECYRCDYHRDDVALYQTMLLIRNRLSICTEVLNPVDRTQKLTYKQEYVNQVERLEEKLGSAIDGLQPLFKPDCSRIDAIKAWNSVFQHPYWEGLLEVEEAKARGESLRKAIQSGSLYVTQSGGIETSPTSNRSVKVPEHRFYGGDAV